jgi:MarR family transcriptional regulator, organic hydroperoxide resistance regulator
MSKNEQFFPLEDALCFALYNAHRLMNQAYRPYLSELGLTYPQFLVLICLWNRDNQNLTEIGDTLLLDSGTLTPLIKRLIESGFINKVRSSSDERKITVSLTKEGKKLREKTDKIPSGMFCKLKLSEKKFITIREEVKTLIKNLKESVNSELTN